MEILARECKKDGEKCMKEEKYFEAMLHFTKGIKYDPHNPDIYFCRSLSFLRIQQFHYALEDASTVIRMLPKWPKGYLRKAEIESTTEHFEAAVDTLKKGLEVSRDDPHLQITLEKTRDLWKIQRKAEGRIPWYGIFLGFICGMILVVTDEQLSKKPILQDDYIRSLSLVTIVTVCYVFALLYRYFIKAQRASLLEAPVDLMTDDSSDPLDQLPSSSDRHRTK